MQRDALGCGNGGAHSLTNAARLSAGGRAPWSDASAGSGHDVGRVEGSGLVDLPATWERIMMCRAWREACDTLTRYALHL